MMPYSTGIYLGDHDIQMRNTKYWSEEAGKKIVAIQNKLDPEMRICEYIYIYIKGK